MVSTSIVQATKDVKFEFEYNPAYSPLVVAVERLIGVLGLGELAEVYFEARGAEDALKALVAKVTGADPTVAGQIVDDLFSESFPVAFDKALSDIASLAGSHTPPVSTSTPTPAELVKAADRKKVEAEIYGPRQISFGVVLEAKRAGLVTKGLETGASAMEVADAWNDQYGKDVMEARLGLLYTHATETEGDAFAETMQLISMHEVGIAKVTGEEVEDVRKRIKGTASP